MLETFFIQLFFKNRWLLFFGGGLYAMGLINKNIINQLIVIHGRFVLRGCSEALPLLLLLPLFSFYEEVMGLFSYLSVISSSFLNRMLTMLAKRPLFSKSCKEDTSGRKKQGERTTDML